MKPVLQPLVIVILGITLAFAARAEVWTQTNGLRAPYPAMSADGSVFVAVGAATFVSHDYGATWRSNNVPGSAVTISASGSNIVIGGTSAICTSTDAGLTWATQGTPPVFGPFNKVRQIACSGDGQRLGLVLYGTCPVLTSADGGVTWSTNNDSPVTYWSGVASSADGRQLAAAGQNTGLWMSTNYGVNWFLAWSSNVTVTACSADAQKWVAGGINRIFMSSDFGATWSEQEVPNFNPAGAVSSADGTRLALTCYQGVFMSTDSGLTWSNANLPALAWDGLATSADGHRWLAHSSGIGVIYLGASTPEPLLQSAPAGDGVSISWVIPSTPLLFQETTSLQTGSWSAVTESPVMDLNTLHDEVNVPALNAVGFFRLASP